VAVAVVPIPSKFCVYGVDVDKDIAANTAYTHINARTEIEAPINVDLVRIRFEVIGREIRWFWMGLVLENMKILSRGWKLKKLD